MKRSKFAEAQIAFILRQAEEGTVVGEVCRKAGISEATFYNWRKKYHGLAPSEMSGCTSSRRRTANSRRSWRSVALSGTRPTLTEAHWKKAGSLVQGWGAVQKRLEAINHWPNTWGQPWRSLNRKTLFLAS